MFTNTTDMLRVSWPVLLLQVQEKLLNWIQFCSGDRRLEVRRDNRRAAIDKNSLMSLGLDRKSHETISGNQRQTCWQNQPVGWGGCHAYRGGGSKSRHKCFIPIRFLEWMKGLGHLEFFCLILNPVLVFGGCLPVLNCFFFFYPQGNTVAFVILCAA